MRFISLLLFCMSVSLFAKIDGMVLIPQGEFLMGKGTDTGADFSPMHSVSVDSFYMDIYPVTNAEYLLFCQDTGHRLPEFWGTDVFKSGENFPHHPVIGVSWFDARKYAKWAGKRLPTEAEWEYAARGGLEQQEFPNGESEWLLPQRRNKAGEPWQNQIVPVGAYAANAFGLFDMGGNVWEWCADKYQHDYYAHSPHDNPLGPSKETHRVIRGGSWHSGSMCKKVYYRKGLPGSWADFAVGFRCVRPPSL